MVSPLILSHSGEGRAHLHSHLHGHAQRQVSAVRLRDPKVGHLLLLLFIFVVGRVGGEWVVTSLASKWFVFCQT